MSATGGFNTIQPKDAPREMGDVGKLLAANDLELDNQVEGFVLCWDNLLFGRFRIVAAAATTGIASIDVPYFKGDNACLEREATASCKLGMTGKTALHAEQLAAAINTIFTPSPDAVAHARAVMAPSNAAGATTPVLAGHVIDPAMVREAERVLAIDARIRAHASDAESSAIHVL